MPEVTGSSPVGSTIVVSLLFFLASLCASASPIEAILGWQGIPVIGAVNPLYVRLANPGPGVLRGSLAVSQRVGSLWRGWAERVLELPVLLPPGGSAAYLLPWPLLPGERTIRLELRDRMGTLGEATLELPPPAEGLSGYIGTPPGDLPAIPAIPLSPVQLPRDPLLLSPFRALSVGDIALPPGAREALEAWEAFLREGKPLFTRKALLSALGEVPLSRRPLGAVAAGALLYLGALYFAVGRLAREGDWRPCLALLLVAIAASTAAAVAFIRGERAVEVRWEIRDPRAPGHGLFFAAVAAKEAADWELPGTWIELLPEDEGGWSGRDLRWTLDAGGGRTSFSVAPGKERIFWTIAPRGEVPPTEGFTVLDGGIRAPDGRVLSPEGFIRGLSRGLRPLVRELLGGLAPGDGIRLGCYKEEGRDHVRYGFAIVLERAEG